MKIVNNPSHFIDNTLSSTSLLRAGDVMVHGELAFLVTTEVGVKILSGDRNTRGARGGTIDFKILADRRGARTDGITLWSGLDVRADGTVHMSGGDFDVAGGGTSVCSRIPLLDVNCFAEVGTIVSISGVKGNRWMG